ncbi:unnamed protein product [Lymnaea stagnalis]|uniref:Cystatin domain-containing protein n=1 Tax=Lymnaea stagnalis TaxID=6523 RepID=A0AAV2H3G2_LYMST
MLLLPLLVALTLAQDDASTTPAEFYETETPVFDFFTWEPQEQPEEPEMPQFLPGGWYPINPDADNRALKFGLDAGQRYLAEQGHNGEFELIDIISASSQTVAGYNYKFTVRVKSGCKTFQCSFAVFESIWGSPEFSLTGAVQCDKE